METETMQFEAFGRHRTRPSHPWHIRLWRDFLAGYKRRKRRDERHYRENYLDYQW